jgi:hypothetical protein
MAATSTRNPAATQKASPAAGGSPAALTPIWIRLPRVGETDLRDDESLDGEATARSFSQSRHDSTAESPKTADGRRDASGSRKSKAAPREAVEEDDLLEEAPAYLREVADRQRSAAFAKDDEEALDVDAAPAHANRSKHRGSRPEVRPSANFFTHVFKAPYNVLAGVALVGVFVGLYACFKPGTGSTDAVPDLDAGPSLTLDMGELSSPPEPYVGVPTAVDPSTLYPETSFPADGGFRPAEEFPPVAGVASATYGSSPYDQSPYGQAPTMPADPTMAPAIGSASSGTAAINASAKVSVDADPSLAGLPVQTYPETNPATYRYPADANFDLSSGVDRTAEGATAAPRAASLGDTLEKTPVR